VEEDSFDLSDLEEANAPKVWDWEGSSLVVVPHGVKNSSCGVRMDRWSTSA